MHYFAAKGTDGRQVIFLAGKIDVSNSKWQKICDNLICKSDICVDRSLFESPRVREGELCL